MKLSVFWLLKLDTCLEYSVLFLLSVQVNDAESTVGIEFTPTIPHCSMATLIGLSIKVKLLRSLPDRFKVCLLMEFLPDSFCSYLSYFFVGAQIDVHITPGTHASEEAGSQADTILLLKS